MIFRQLRGLLLLSAAAASAGCEPNHLAYVHHMNLGIDAGAAPTEGHAKLSLGYDRHTYSLVPRAGKGMKTDDAMSVTAVSHVHAQGLAKVRFGHAIATGAPASEIARNPGTLAGIVDNVFYPKQASSGSEK